MGIRANLKKIIQPSDGGPGKGSRNGKPTASQKKAQFKKGYDPRRWMGGRPKLGHTLAEKYREVFNEALDPENPDFTVGDAIIEIAVKRALKGDLAAIQYIEARGFGKVPDVVELIRDKTDEIDLTKWDADDLKKYEQLLKKYHADRG